MFNRINLRTSNSNYVYLVINVIKISMRAYIGSGSLKCIGVWDLKIHSLDKNLAVLMICDQLTIEHVWSAFY